MESNELRLLALSLYEEPLNKRGEKRTKLVGSSDTPYGFNKWFRAFKIGYEQGKIKNNG